MLYPAQVGRTVSACRNDAQSGPVTVPAVSIEDRTPPVGPKGETHIGFIRTEGALDPVEPCAMRIGPSRWSTVHGQEEAAPRSLPTGAASDVRKHLRRFVRDPIIAERADRSRELLPFRRWGDVGQYSRVEDDERSILWRLSGERREVGA